MKPYRIVLACLAALAVQSLRGDDALDFRDMAEEFIQCYGTYQGAAQIMAEGGAAASAKVMKESANGAWVAAATLLSANEVQAGKPIEKLGYYDEYIKNKAAPQTSRILAESEFNALAGETESPILTEALQFCTALKPLQGELVDHARNQAYGLTE